MLQRNKYITIAIGVLITLIVTITTLYITKIEKPFDIIEKTLNLKLQNVVKIQNFTYPDEDGYYYAKALVKEQNVIILKNKLQEAFFENIATEEDIENMPNFINTCPWWDLDENNISIAYNMFVWGEYPLPDSREVWAFITEKKDDEYYLYIVY